MKRLIFINRFFYPDNSATSLILTELCVTLAKTYPELEVIVLAGDAMHISSGNNLKPDLSKVMLKRFRQFKSRKRYASIEIFNFLIFYIQVFFWLLLKSHSSDTVVAKSDPPLLSVPVAFSRVFKGFKFVSWQQDIFPETAVAAGILKNKVLIWLIKAVRLISLKFADVVVVPGNQMKLYLANSGIIENRILVIENFALSNIKRVEAVNAQRTRQGPMVIGYSGNLGRAHRIDLIFDLIKALQDFEGVRFQINGGGFGYSRLKRECERMQFKNVDFIGYVPLEDLNVELNNFAWHLISIDKNFEQYVFPSKFYNAIRLGAPSILIGSKSSDLFNFVTDYGMGLCISEIADVDLCADIVTQCANDISLLNKFEKNVIVAQGFFGDSKNSAKRWRDIC